VAQEKNRSLKRRFLPCPGHCMAHEGREEEEKKKKKGNHAVKRNCRGKPIGNVYMTRSGQRLQQGVEEGGGLTKRGEKKRGGVSGNVQEKVKHGYEGGIAAAWKGAIKHSAAVDKRGKK